MGARVALSLKTACDYRKFRPCLNQDLCGTLITDLFEAAPRSRRTWSLLPCPVDECILAQGVRVAKQSGFGSAYFGGIDQGEAAFPLEEGKRRRRRLAPAKRRVAGIGGGVPPPAESKGRGLVPAAPPLGAPACPWVCGAEANIWPPWIDRKSTRLNSSHRCISYAVFCLKK